MQLSIQLYAIVSVILISERIAKAENVIRYLFNDGEAPTGVKCTPAEIEKITTTFEAINAPMKLRKRSVDLPERVLDSRQDIIHHISFDGAGFPGDEVSYHPPLCDDKCNGYHPDECFATSIKHIVGNRHRDLQLSTGNRTKGVGGMTTQRVFPPKCKSLCEGQVDNNCMGVPGCQGYRRELVSRNQEDREFTLLSITSQSFPTDSAGWCVKASEAIDQQLKALVNQVSPQCYVMIQAPRRKECYDDVAICSSE
jgi:hypothetical protein